MIKNYLIKKSTIYTNDKLEEGLKRKLDNYIKNNNINYILNK